MQKVAAFDLDGTILDAESPLKLTTYLTGHRALSFPKIVQMAWWGFRYRLRLPQTETTPREILFSALTKPTVEQVDVEIMQIYRNKIQKYIRKDARKAIERCRQQNYFLLLATASFKPITNAIVYELKMDGQVSTVMEEIDGHYTSKVAGQPIQGAQKITAICEYCDMLFGEGKWELTEAYSDHYSDLPMLEYAKRPIVVDPDPKLERISKKRSWPVVKWN